MKIKTLTFALLSCFFSLTVFSQSAVTATVHVNNVKVTVRSDGTLFWDGENGQFIAPFEVGQPENSTLRSTGLWLAGRGVETNELKGDIQLYQDGDNTDFIPGPLEASTGLPTGTITDIYRVTGAEIEAHLADLDDNGVVDNPIPNIYGWPGDNSPHFFDYHGENLPPVFYGYKNFFDRHGDGIYDPDVGDYPAIIVRGCDDFPMHPDEMLWFVFNDQVEHTVSGMEPVRMEIQCQMYIFNCEESPFGNTVFVRYRLNNRSEEDLDSTYFGVFTDFDIGNPDDDFYGIDVSRNLAFGYNGDEDDEGGYGNNAPAMAVDFLRGPLDSSRTELGLSSFMPAGNVPLASGEEYYKVLSGLLPDGTPAPNDGFFYDGNPNVPGEWSEVDEGNVPGDRKAVASFGPFYLREGAVNEIIVAYTFYQKPDNTPLENVATMYEEADAVQALFDNCFDLTGLGECTPLVSGIFEKAELEPLKLFPNPASEKAVIELPESGLEKITLSTLDGREVLSQKTNLGQIETSLNLKGLAAGFYLVKGWKNGQAVAREKLVIMKN